MNLSSSAWRYDDAQLAARARTTLAGADAGWLRTAAAGWPSTPVVVRVIDDDGEALIVCDPSGPLARAATGRRLAGLVVPANPTFGVRLRLVGRLGPTELVAAGASVAIDLARQVAGPSASAVVALRVDHVSVGCPRPIGSSGATEQPVPLAAYAVAQPDLLAANLPRLTRTLNGAHAAQLRCLAAHLGRAELAGIAACALSALDPDGFVLHWIDAAGGHERRVDFAQRAVSLAGVTHEMRRRLRAAAADLAR